jgi:hypothetical protein
MHRTPLRAEEAFGGVGCYAVERGSWKQNKQLHHALHKQNLRARRQLSRRLSSPLAAHRASFSLSGPAERLTPPRSGLARRSPIATQWPRFCPAGTYIPLHTLRGREEIALSA